MIDASAIMFLGIIFSVFLWITTLFKIVLSPLDNMYKWKVVGMLLIFAILFSFLPYGVTKVFNIKGYGIPSAIVIVLFIGLLILNSIVGGNIKRYNMQNKKNNRINK